MKKFHFDYTLAGYDEVRRRIAELKRQRKKRDRITIGISAFVLLGVIAAIILVITLGVQNKKDSLCGSWIYDDYYYYDFDGSGNGCLRVEEIKYDYTYKIEKHTLYLDFADESIHDCEYTFEVKGKVLYLTGGEGTVGGDYTLYKE